MSASTRVNGAYCVQPLLTGEQDPQASWVVEPSHTVEGHWAIRVSSPSGATDGSWVATCPRREDADFIAQAFAERRKREQALRFVHVTARASLEPGSGYRNRDVRDAAIRALAAGVDNDDIQNAIDTAFIKG